MGPMAKTLGHWRALIHFGCRVARRVRSNIDVQIEIVAANGMTLAISANGNLGTPASRCLPLLCIDSEIEMQWRIVAPLRETICSAAGSALDLEVLCGRFALVRDFFVFDDLPLIEAAKAGFLDSRDMDKYVFAAVLRLNETVTLGRVEPFDRTLRHLAISRVDALR
jgi:hypothetical protein